MAFHKILGRVIQLCCLLKFKPIKYCCYTSISIHLFWMGWKWHQPSNWDLCFNLKFNMRPIVGWLALASYGLLIRGYSYQNLQYGYPVSCKRKINGKRRKKLKTPWKNDITSKPQFLMRDETVKWYYTYRLDTESMSDDVCWIWDGNVLPDMKTFMAITYFVTIG